jgi:hypothetical protein
MSYECIYCDFKAPTNTRLKRHLATQKHAMNIEKQQLEVENPDIVPQIIEDSKLCENMDCERYPPDWDFEEDTEETYQQGQWKKCCLCDGYFDDDGMGDILYVQEEPNNQEVECSLCGKTEDIVQMKGCGQYLCGNACDEEDSVQEEEEVKEDEEDSVQEEEEVKEDEDDVDKRFINAINNWCKNNPDECSKLLTNLEKEDSVQEEEENPDAFECDDCNKKGVDCFENLGLIKEEVAIYMDLGEPDRCEDCFNKWLKTDDANEYMKETKGTTHIDMGVQTDIEECCYDSNNNISDLEEDSVQEGSDDESPYNMRTFLDNYNLFILDIKTKEMMKNINETLIAHPFIMRVVNVFMNIVWFFSSG